MHAAIDKTAFHFRHESSLSMRSVARQFATVAIALALSSAAMAFQIAPMGSAFESKLTNETENSLATVAGRLGVLIKGRVHEEITQIGMGCPIEPGTLAQDVSCSSRDLPFATPYVIYGVRWNDLPRSSFHPTRATAPTWASPATCPRPSGSPRSRFVGTASSRMQRRKHRPNRSLGAARPRAVFTAM